MRSPRLSLLLTVGALGSLAACAAIADIRLPPGLDVPVEGVQPLETALAFDVACPSTTSDHDLELVNNGSTDKTAVIAVPNDAPLFLLDDAGQKQKTLTKTVHARRREKVRLRAEPTKPVPYSGALTIQATDQAEATVDLTVATRGVELTVFPTVVDFGEVMQNTSPPPQPVQITNSGNTDVKLASFTAQNGGTDFTLDVPAGTVIKAGANITVNATFIAGSAGSLLSDTMVAQPDFSSSPKVGLCGAVPTVEVRGTRVNRDVTVTPTTIDFGTMDCNAPGGQTQTLKLTNLGNKPVAFSLSGLDAQSRFSLSRTQGSIDPAGSGANTGEVTVTLNPMTPEVREFSETLTIDLTGAAGSEPYAPIQRELKVKTAGAILSITPDPGNFNLAIAGGYSQRTFHVTNTGNKFVYLEHTASGPGFGISGSANTAVFPASGDNPFLRDPDFDVRFSASDNGAYAGTITTVQKPTPKDTFLLPPSGVICNTLTPVVLSGVRNVN